MADVVPIDMGIRLFLLLFLSILHLLSIFWIIIVFLLGTAWSLIILLMLIVAGRIWIRDIGKIILVLRGLYHWFLQRREVNEQILIIKRKDMLQVLYEDAIHIRVVADHQSREDKAHLDQALLDLPYRLDHLYVRVCHSVQNHL